jgi:5'-deoxynucleotidase YfbR-like HD superfamily hydrolase
MLCYTAFMPKPELEDIKKLVHELVLPFYLIDRDMDIQITDIKHRKETDAEHAWSIALVACSIAPLIDKKLDVGKIAQLAVVHDLVEVYAGDVSIWGTKEDLAQKDKREAASLKKLEQEFGHFPWLIENIKEYEVKSSNEALFVNAVDKLVPFFFRILVKPAPFERMQLSLEEFKVGIEKSRKKVKSHPVISQYFEEMLDIFFSHPEYFYKAR